MQDVYAFIERAAAAALAEGEERFHALVDDAPFAIWVVGPQGEASLSTAPAGSSPAGARRTYGRQTSASCSTRRTLRTSWTGCARRFGAARVRG